MENVTSSQLRAMFLRFYKEKGHAVIASASVIPENDPTFCSPRPACTRWCPIFWAPSTRRARG